MNMKRIALLSMLMVGLATAANAGNVAFSFTYGDVNGNTATFSGTGHNGLGGSFSVSDYLIDTGSLTVTSGAAAGSYSLVAGGPSVFGIPGFNVDNVLYSGSDPKLDTWGLAFAGVGNPGVTICAASTTSAG